MKHLVATFWLAVFSMLYVSDSHAAKITYISQHNVVVVDGVIDDGDAEKFIQTMKQVDLEKPTLVVLQSQGGLLAEAFIIASVVNKYGVSTYVTTTCASACSVIFAAGDTRMLEEKGKVGLHNPYLPAKEDTPRKDSEVGSSIWWKVYGSFVASFNEEKLAKKWVDRTFKTPSETMYWIDNLSAEDYGITVL